MSATTLTPQPQTQSPRFRQKRKRKQTPHSVKLRDDVVTRSEECLRLHPHFRGRNFALKFEVQQGRLIISGQLPSYFHKQLVQEAIRDIDNLEIDNQIIVSAEN